ncbi:hypothetical protein M011DRAFT_302926 [Sporormia fimetaria CBS 119925]|uniref:GIY-YIG domain-containing protein n=1 Tax=Sporormia fimetaria CBS 119925 TaxID=1340428 RepID=A0A6A6VJ92_9PLEO|nr:hypothetical protein M011DRAFT_302926 [Sporormia fimetaria CBS 119925]
MSASQPISDVKSSRYKDPMLSRYQAILNIDRSELVEQLIARLRPTVLWFMSEVPADRTLSLRKLSLPQIKDAPAKAGTYIHVITMLDGVSIYAGQATDLRRRLSQQTMPSKLKDTKHCQDWLKSREEGGEDFWVIVSEFDMPDDPKDFAASNSTSLRCSRR